MSHYGMIIVSKYIVMIGKLMNYGATYVLYIFVVYYKKLYKGREVLDKLLVPTYLVWI